MTARIILLLSLVGGAHASNMCSHWHSPTRADLSVGAADCIAGGDQDINKGSKCLKAEWWNGTDYAITQSCSTWDGLDICEAYENVGGCCTTPATAQLPSAKIMCGVGGYTAAPAATDFANCKQTCTWAKAYVKLSLMGVPTGLKAHFVPGYFKDGAPCTLTGATVCKPANDQPFLKDGKAGANAKTYNLKKILEDAVGLIYLGSASARATLIGNPTWVEKVDGTTDMISLIMALPLGANAWASKTTGDTIRAVTDATATLKLNEAFKGAFPLKPSTGAGAYDGTTKPVAASYEAVASRIMVTATPAVPLTVTHVYLQDAEFPRPPLTTTPAATAYAGYSGKVSTVDETAEKTSLVQQGSSPNPFVSGVLGFMLGCGVLGLFARFVGQRRTPSNYVSAESQMLASEVGDA